MISKKKWLVSALIIIGGLVSGVSKADDFRPKTKTNDHEFLFKKEVDRDLYDALVSGQPVEKLETLLNQGASLNAVPGVDSSKDSEAPMRPFPLVYYALSGAFHNGMNASVDDAIAWALRHPSTDVSIDKFRAQNLYTKLGRNLWQSHGDHLVPTSPERYTRDGAAARRFLRILLDRGVDPQARDAFGNSVFHYLRDLQKVEGEDLRLWFIEEVRKQNAKSGTNVRRRSGLQFLESQRAHDDVK